MSERQSVDLVETGTGNPQRGGAVLTRTRDRLHVSVAAMDLSSNSAYSVW